MREIKFRIFDKHRKYMYKVDTLFLDEGMFRAINHETEEDVFSYGTPYFSEPMQFTGLLDKNGVEIYEGDIIELHHEPITILKKVLDEVREVTEHRVSDPAEIWYEEAQFVYGWRDIAYSALNIESNRVIRNKRINNINVIGNIYENPELLKETKC